MKDYDLKPYHHSIELAVRFMDIDAFDHVNNARHLNFLEEARIAYCQEVLGLFFETKQFNVLVANINIDFIRPIPFNSKLKIFTRVCQIGNSSFTFESLVFVREKENQWLASKAKQVIVYFDPKTGSSASLPRDIKQKIADFED